MTMVLLAAMAVSAASAEDSPLVALAKRTNRKASKTPVITNEMVARSQGRLSMPAGETPSASNALPPLSPASTPRPATTRAAGPSKSQATVATTTATPTTTPTTATPNGPSSTARSYEIQSTARTVTPQSTVRTVEPYSGAGRIEAQSTAQTIQPASTAQYVPPPQ